MSDPAKYRTKEEVAAYKAQDPIEQVRQRILELGHATEEELKIIEGKVKAQVKECVDFAEQSPWPDPSEIYNDVYAEEGYPFIKE